MPPSGCLPVTVPLSARSLVGSLRAERWLAAWLVESAGGLVGMGHLDISAAMVLSPFGTVDG